MWMLPRVRLALARRPWLYWCIVAAVSLLVWWQVSSLHHAAAMAKAGWGTTRTVWVTERAAEPGAPLVATAQQYPAVMVPHQAVSVVEVGAVAARAVAERAVIVAADVVDDQLSPAGWVVVAVPAERGPVLRMGESVAVFAGGRALCEGLVTAALADVVEVAVPADCAALLSAELSVDDILLARDA